MAFNVTYYEGLKGGNAFEGLPMLQGAGWVMLVFATVFSFFTIISLFDEPIDPRPSKPSTAELWGLLAFFLANHFLMPVFAGEPPDPWNVEPTFLPKAAPFQLAFRFVCAFLGMVSILFALNKFVSARLSILPQ